MMFAQTGAEPEQLAQTGTSTRMRTLHDMPEEMRMEYAQLINSQDLPWKAAAYTATELAQLESAHPFSFAQMGSASQFGTASNFEEVLEDAQAYIRAGIHPSEIDNDELPLEFDWSDFHGHGGDFSQGTDFTGPIRDQSTCGSCYMIATNSMLESRIKIWYGEERSLSTQFPLQCNFLTEGCHGGWGLFYGMFLESYYTVNETDAPYEHKTVFDGCGDFEHVENKKVASVDESYYVGGAYGLQSEEKLMKEIFARGPVLYDFNAGYDFMTYKSGVLQESGNPYGIDDFEYIWKLDNPDEPNDITQDG